MLKRLLVITLIWCALITLLVLYIQSWTQLKDSRRKLIYLQASRLAAEEQQKQVDEYKRKLALQRRTREYNQGTVVNYNEQ